MVLPQEILSDIVEVYLRDSRERFTALRSAVERRDAEHIARLAHGLAGSSANLGAAQLASRLRRIESAAKGGTCTVDMTELEEYFERARGAFRAYLDEHARPRAAG
jgi:HPt (histidine-containing phosphotransfer) domain-containing protein